MRDCSEKGRRVRSRTGSRGRTHPAPGRLDTGGADHGMGRRGGAGAGGTRGPHSPAEPHSWALSPRSAPRLRRLRHVAARDERLRRDVAIKVIDRAHTDDDHAGREARVAARLNHPNVVALYELGVDDDNVYLVSELVDGRTLAELIADNALSDRDIARIGAALCDGLAHAHERGVVHRDVKPQNVMVVAEPARGSGFAKLTDFGIAHLASDEPLTRTGDVVGTLAYMAPEQAEGLLVTWEADVYSLSLTLYEA